MKRRYTLKKLEDLPTISQGQADDLKVEESNKRVWLSRLTIADGMPYNNQVTVETLKGGYTAVTRADYRKGRKGTFINPKWETMETYEAL